MEQTEHSQMTGELQLSEAGRAVLMQRYVERDGNGNPVETPEQLFHRVATAVASAEHAYGTPPPEHTRLEQDFYAMMLSGRFLPNSPTLMNAGRGTGMLSGCFVVPVPDSVEGIFSAIRCAALIQKAGGGTGFNFSRLRPRGDHVESSSGTTSGPVSFMRVFSAATRSIQQGAFRRGANMGVMRVDHPDIIEFLYAKKEDSELTNFNLSVGVSDRFIKQVINTPDAAHMVTNPRNGATDCLWKEDGSVPWCVGELFDLMTTRAWANGEPGLLFLDRIKM
jgi:ribonucleoside-diphosphate reductase alpha chain